MSYFCYMLYAPDCGRTYICITTDVQRRLRQHNGEISGGSKYTTSTSKQWESVIIVSGFWDRGEAMVFEHQAKRDENLDICHGYMNRKSNFHRVVDKFNSEERKGVPIYYVKGEPDPENNVWL